ncbi:hypothetical protein NM688_g1799 [Phlebia brevispora]|uniref:Uncharacterized protein n=1 Tax=Phlebia brevispora TaxID=194682 RepID=A0ACC1TA65_9APHY|nr:hypothetical protein NM688_g1799 [Phlebia brevispora]
MTASVEDVANKFFDYVIVGGGTAGLTLAARLSEDPSKTVLVLEGGGANVQDPNILRPASFGAHFGNEQYCFDYQSIEQAHLSDRKIDLQRGKGLGGSSAINFLCWTKPSVKDIDDFERLGNPGWNWDNYESFIARSEGFVDPPEEIKKKFKLDVDNWKIGRDGPINLSFPGKIEEAELKIQETFLNSGLSLAPKPLSGDPKGVFFIPNTYDPKTHTRSYSTTAFYLPNKDRANLTVLVNAPARRVLTEQAGNGRMSAVGVEFEHANRVYVVNVASEVILSAGSLQSPHILELSGIGRKEILERINVQTKIELPGVGENVQEHMLVGISWELKDDIAWDTLDLLRDPAVAEKHLELHATGEGLYTTGIIGFAFTTLDQYSPEAGNIYQSMKDKIAQMDPKTSPAGLLEQYRIQLERFEPGAGSPGCEFISLPVFLSGPNPPVPGKRYASILVATNHTFSRGTIHSVSEDPAKNPHYDPHYFEQGVDLDIHTEMTKYARKLAEITPFKDMIAKEANPGPEVQTDEQLREWIKSTVLSTWHTAGSCSMLPLEKNGVVDPTLKVYGTNNLRVVDLSVVPLHIGAHPQATVYAIAEQAADIIKGKFTA